MAVYQTLSLLAGFVILLGAAVGGMYWVNARKKD